MCNYRFPDALDKTNSDYIYILNCFILSCYTSNIFSQEKHIQLKIKGKKVKKKKKNNQIRTFSLLTSVINIFEYFTSDLDLPK